MSSRLIESQAVEREVQRVAGHLPEIDVAILQRAQPRILQLLVAPQCRQRAPLLIWNVGATCDGGGEIEDRAVSIKNAGANTSQAAHRCVPPIIALRPFSGAP